MATVTLKNIPDKMFADLKEEAKNNHRSLNGEMLFALQFYLSLKNVRPGPEEVIRKAREFRAKVNVVLSPEEIDRAINEGRP